MDIENKRWRLALTEDVLKSFSSAMRNRSLYPPQHPIVEASCTRLADKLDHASSRGHESWTIVLLGGEFVFEKVPLPKISALVRPLYHALESKRVESLTLQNGISAQELSVFLTMLLSDDPIWQREGDFAGQLAAKGISNLALKRVELTSDITAGPTNTDEARDIYSSLRTALLRFFISMFDQSKTPSMGLINVLVERIAGAMHADRFAMISRLHTKHDPRDLISHSINTAIVSYVTAEAMGLELDLLQKIAVAGLLHDIGLIDIPPQIENGVLYSSEDPRVQIEHPMRAVGILRAIPSVPQIAEVVALEHHMRVDGKGFPRVKQDQPQSPASSIVALASTYDRLMHGDQYISPEEIPQKLISTAGSMFEPSVLAHLIVGLGVYPPGSYVKLSNGETALVLLPSRTDVMRPTVKLLFGRDGDEYLEERVIDLTERASVTGKFQASIVHSVPPNELAL
ncbi:MAG: HD domain-containing protein [Candidatus Alcyoniella australis]|nr:HD domain-containing protein [Candidatus Alcyoniella australis]